MNNYYHNQYWPQGQDSNLLREGLEKLKTAALFQIIATLITAVAIPYIVFLSVFPVALSHMLPHATPWTIPAAVGVALLATVAAAVISLISVYAYLVPSFATLAEYNRSEFGTVSTLVKVGFIWGLILLISSIALIIVGAVALIPLLILGIVLLIVSLVLIFIGWIGVIIGMFKLHDLTQDSLFMAAGILFIISIFLGVLGFIAWIIVFMACKNSLEKFGSRQAYPVTWGPQGPT